MHLVQSCVLESFASVPAHARIPAEVWCQVFSFLSQPDRFAVSRVSRNWRSVTIESPSLWTDIDYYCAIQNKTCTCQTCSEDVRHPPCMGCGQRFPSEVNNLGEVRTALARSGDMPLRLEVTLAGQATSFFIASLLRPNAERITSLHISTDICLEGTDLLFNFDLYNQRPIAFVNLKRLVMRITAKPEVDEDDDLPIRLFDASTAQMPVLHHLELQGPY